ncbi:MAG: hypothetical protein COV67_11640 [Nitrospinae bacterium CG11_big_fil_rev_8_21_14_0_20_56_8]|nr:MAG: hypothetical protein COV67_11640 [Nitrospinae bacterium CG11_big_fil_rev_8_21_14_0_20_56_8]
MDKQGHLLVVDRSHYRIRQIDLASGQVATVAGNGKKLFGGDGGPATGAVLDFPHGLAVDSKDNLYVSDKSHFRIRKINPNGIITTIAGNGVRGNIGNGIPALEANLYGVTTLAISHKGEIYLVSPSGFVSIIRKIDAKGIIHNVLDTSDPKYLETIKKDKYRGLSASSKIEAITQFSDLTFDSKDNLYIPDRINHQIRKLDLKGNISTIAGTGESDYFGDGGPGVKAAFRDPGSVALDANGNLFIADTANNRIRKIDTKGIITTFAGNGRHEDSGDGGPALQAGLRSMDDLVFSPSGELYIVGSITHIIRKIGKDGKIETVAGNGYGGYAGDNGPAVSAMLKNPSAAAFDSKGNMYISDMGNNRIRKISPDGTITTFAGSGEIGWGLSGETVEIYFQNFP